MNATEHGGLEGRPSREAPAAPEARIRCVLLARRDARERTEDLVALLERRGVDVAVRHDAFGAIAAALQGGGGGPAAVVVV
ncbi:MAG: hypothetical protein VYC34_04480, partial [Planctomycetota bacterium]|nr:hypothetical protein [Planctomycetota bacterium]